MILSFLGFHQHTLVKAVLLLVVALPCAARAMADDIALYVMAGQSNMVGQKGDAAKYPADPEKLDAGIPFYWSGLGNKNLSHSDGWTTLKPQGGLFKAGHFGPEVSFARALAVDFKQGKTKQRPAVFKCAVGATSIAGFWKTPGQGGQYDKMMVELKEAIALLQKQGHTVKVSGFVWIQGESDAKTPAMAKAYGPALDAIVKDFRNATNAQVPVILGVDEQHPSVKANPDVVAAQADIAKKEPGVIVTSMLGLPKADSTHLVPAGVVEHGKRLYAAYRILVPLGKNTADAKADTKPPTPSPLN